jgi:hypothetical protein
MKPFAALARLVLAASSLAVASTDCAALALPQSGSSRGTWATKAPLPTKRFEVGAVTMGNRIYVVAGESNGQPATNLLTEYDPAANRWRDLAPMP